MNKPKINLIWRSDINGEERYYCQEVVFDKKTKRTEFVRSRISKSFFEHLKTQTETIVDVTR